MRYDQRIKESMAKYAAKSHQRGFVAGPGGNLSVRGEKVFYISPHGLFFEELTADDIVVLDLETGNLLEGTRFPSWEFRVHQDIYLTKDNVKAIIHVHSPYTIGLISGGMDFKAIIPEFSSLGELPVIDYILPGGEELRNAILKAVKKSDVGLLLRNHGSYAFGENIREAYYRIELIESACQTALMAKLAGKPRFLTDFENERIRDLFKEKKKEAEIYVSKIKGG